MSKKKDLQISELITETIVMKEKIDILLNMNTEEMTRHKTKEDALEREHKSALYKLKVAAEDIGSLEKELFDAAGMAIEKDRGIRNSINDFVRVNNPALYAAFEATEMIHSAELTSSVNSMLPPSLLILKLIKDKL